MPEFQFDSFGDFLAMGGYGIYVWASYAFFTIVIAYNLIQPSIVRRRFFRQQVARMTREQVRKGDS